MSKLFYLLLFSIHISILPIDQTKKNPRLKHLSIDCLAESNITKILPSLTNLTGCTLYSKDPTHDPLPTIKALIEHQNNNEKKIEYFSFKTPTITLQQLKSILELKYLSTLALSEGKMSVSLLAKLIAHLKERESKPCYTPIQKLILHNNNLDSLPINISLLTKLKIVDARLNKHLNSFFSVASGKILHKRTPNLLILYDNVNLLAHRLLIPLTLFATITYFALHSIDPIQSESYNIILSIASPLCILLMVLLDTF